MVNNNKLIGVGRGDDRIILLNNKINHESSSSDSLAEWSKALDLGSNPKGRGFKSHSCQHPFSPP